MEYTALEVEGELPCGCSSIELGGPVMPPSGPPSIQSLAPISITVPMRLWHRRTDSASFQKGVPLLHDLACAIPAIAFHAVDCRDEFIWLHLAGFDGHHRVTYHA